MFSKSRAQTFRLFAIAICLEFFLKHDISLMERLLFNGHIVQLVALSCQRRMWSCIAGFVRTLYSALPPPVRHLADSASRSRSTRVELAAQRRLHFCSPS